MNLLTTKAITERAGVTIRQLDFWTRKGWVTPVVQSTGTGHPRRWAPWQVGEIVEVRERMRLTP